MAETLSIAGLLIALLLPWMTGASLVHVLMQRAGRWHWTVVAGHGYFVGLFVTVLLLQLCDLALGHVLFWPVATVLLVLTGLFLVAGRITGGSAPTSTHPVDTPPPAWHRVVIGFVLTLIVVRYHVLLQEILLRPLYAWDAWMNWMPKAVVWFQHGTLTAFVSPQEWLQLSVGANVYTLGNAQASHYPPMVPLIQLWQMLGAGTDDHSLLLLPWWLLPISLGLALYGHLRLAGLSTLAATCACYLLLNMPYLNVHTALPGYADSWLAASFGLAVFSLHEWEQQRRWPWAMLSLTMAIICTQLKVPGIVLGLIIMALLVRSWFRLSARYELMLAVLATGLLLAVLLIGFDFNIPGVGRFLLSSNGVSAPVFGDFVLTYHNISGALFEALLVMINWNLLWPLFLLAVTITLLQTRENRQPSGALLSILLALGFLLFVFYLTRHSAAAENFTTINRAFLYPVPALIFYVFVTLASRRQRSAIIDQ